MTSVVTVPDQTFPTTNESLLTTLYRTKPLPETETEHASMRLLGTGLTQRTIDVDWFVEQRGMRQFTGFYTQREIDRDFEITRDDLDDTRVARQREREEASTAMREMIRFTRRGK